MSVNIVVRDSRYIRFISSLIVSWCIFPGEHEALQSGVFLSYEFFWKLLSLSARIWLLSCSIIPSLIFSCSIRCCLTSCMLTGVWLKKAHFFLIHSVEMRLFVTVQEAGALFPVINSDINKAIISTFWESYKPFDSSKSAYFTEVPFSGFAKN